VRSKSRRTVRLNGATINDIERKRSRVADLRWESADALRTAIDRVLSGIPRSELATASAALTERYRGERTGEPLVATTVDAAAYAAARLPATFAAIQAAMRAIPDFEPTSMLDVGAGSGAATWAAVARWPSIVDCTLLDSDAKMLTVGQRLRAADPRRPAGEWNWQTGDIGAARFGQHDLVVAGYALGELDPVHRIAAAQAMWAATTGTLLIVEPGTPVGFAVIRELRDALIDAGAALIAPCPHERKCPMTGTDWCHFSARVQRSALHRQVKAAELSYEDEKFSYVAFTRHTAERVAGRVLRHPGRPPKRVELVACTDTGLRNITIGKSHPDYRTAKKLNWGSEIPTTLLPAK
jgi:ribosomal protein RSM22 (predicted rRNA methylase)